MADDGEGRAADERPPPKPNPLTSTAEGLFARIRTGEWPVVRIDLSEAYANVRRRANTLRRRRIISSTIAGVVLASLATVLGVYYVSQIPLPDALSLPATTTVYYSDGTTVMARLGTQRRVLVQIDTLPEYVGQAVVAAEDPGFFLGSGTWISRQYARAAADVDGGTPSGQARLLVMSWKLEDTYTKRQILGFYLNTVYFGRGSYGIEAAARSYFGVHAAELTVAEAVVLANVISAPGDGTYDPSVDPVSAQTKFRATAERLASLGAVSVTAAQQLRLPTVDRYDPAALESGLDQPTGLIVNHVLAELRATPPFRGKPPGYIEDGGFAIVTTVDARAQTLLEQTADETVTGSVMKGQPSNLQAAAVVVEPGTGGVLAYYGGHDGTGADYAGSYTAADGTVVGFGAHPPGQTFDVYTLAAALQAGISVRSKWDSPSEKQFPASGRTASNPVRDYLGSPCQPACSLTDATTGSLNVPYYALTEKVGAGRVIDAAHAVGIDSMWVPESPGVTRQRYELTEEAGGSLTPRPFGTEVGLGDYPVTVLDQANAMATLADGGHRATAHFVRVVHKDTGTLYTEPAAPVGAPALSRTTVADLTWVLAQNPAGALPDGRPSATKAGVGRLRDTALETAHAWLVGYTANLAMAVWIGNEETEFPLRDKQGARVTGTGLPADIYRIFMGAAHERLGLVRTDFPTPTFGGDAAAGDAH